MIEITEYISIDESEIEERFILAGGPGGQNVNKVATAVQLRFDAARSPALGPQVLHRLKRLAGRRMTKDGVVIITARRFRVQERNRADALDRLKDLIAQAAMPVPHRRPTRVRPGIKRRRLETKRRRGQLKQHRKPVTDNET